MGRLNAFVAVLALLAVATASQASFVAYNDFNVTTGNVANVTNYGPGATGALKDFATGADGPTITVANLGVGAGNSYSNTSGTKEAYSYFPADIINLQGYLYSGGTTNVVRFSGLDTAKQYELVAFGYPGNHETEWMGLTLTGAQSFTNETTIADGAVVSTTTMANDTTQVHQNGAIVIRYSNIVASETGTFAINLLNYTGNTSTRLNAIRLAEVPEPATMALLALGGIGVISRRRK